MKGTQIGVTTMQRQQLVMSPGLGDASILEEVDAIGVLDTAQSVSDTDGRSALGGVIESLQKKKKQKKKKRRRGRKK